MLSAQTEIIRTAAIDWSQFSSVWLFLMQLTVLLVTILFANFIRRRVPFIRRMLFPTALIAGILIFLLKTVLEAFHVPVNNLLDNATMQIITYHMLGLGFVAMALKRPRPHEKVRMGKVFDSALVNGSTYMLQSWTGLLITLLFFGGIFYAGAILPCGFAQGTGNAMTWGGNYAAQDPEHFTGGAGFGLTVATVGFIVGSVFGVVYMNVMRRKGKLKVREESGAKADDPALNGTAPDSISVDKFTVNLALILLTYGVAYVLMLALSSLGGFFQSLAWGLSFMWALLAGMGIKAICGLLEKKNVIRESYRSNYLLDRISGFCFDLMVVAGVAAIEWEDVKAFWLPLTILCVVGTGLTYLQCYLAAKHSFPGFEHETFLVNFGTLTGTINNGMILLREIDPDFSTPAAHYTVTANLFNFMLDAPLFLLLGRINQSTNAAWLCCGLFFVLYVVYTILLFRRSIFRRRYPKENVEVWTDEQGFVRAGDLTSGDGKNG